MIFETTRLWLDQTVLSIAEASNLKYSDGLMGLHLSGRLKSILESPSNPTYPPNQPFIYRTAWSVVHKSLAIIRKLANAA